MKEIEKVNQDPKFREYMTKEEDQKKIYNTQMSKAFNDGISTGEKENSKAIARKMLDKGKEISEIMEFTNLSKEEIEKLK